MGARREARARKRDAPRAKYIKLFRFAQVNITKINRLL